MATAISGRLAAGASSRKVSRKSFFAPCSLTNGIFTGVVISSVIDLDNRLVPDDNPAAYLITRAAQAGTVDNPLNGVAPHHDSPILLEKELGPVLGHHEQQPIVTGQRVTQRYPQRAVN